MLFRRAAVDHDIIDVDKAAFAYESMEGPVHCALEDCRSIGCTKGHTRKFKEALVADESCLWLICLCNGNLPVTTFQVHSAEDRRTLQLVKDVLNQWQRVGVLCGYSIQPAIVHTEALGPIFLWLEGDWGGPRGGTGLYDSCCQHVL